MWGEIIQIVTPYIGWLKHTHTQRRRSWLSPKGDVGVRFVAAPWLPQGEKLGGRSHEDIAAERKHKELEKAKLQRSSCLLERSFSL